MVASRFHGLTVLALISGSLLASGCVPSTVYKGELRRRIALERRTKDYADRVSYLENERARLFATVSNHQVEQQKLSVMLAEAKKAVDWDQFGLSANENGDLTLAGDVSFARGSHALTSTGRATLKKAANALTQAGATVVRVEGHTDSDPIRHSKYADNLHLSVMRAHAVAKYLIVRGVEARNISIAGFGAQKPLGKSKIANRRVEIRALIDEPRTVRISQK